MIILAIGLAIFLGAHSLRMLAPKWRLARIAALGEMRWKLAISVVSLASFALLVWGYGMARADYGDLWPVPSLLKHLVGALVMPAFILLVAAYLPGTRIKARLGHPMLVATKLWALAHLLANSAPADLVLFGSLLFWATTDLISARRRDRAAGVTYAAGSLSRDILAVAIGLALWAGFARYGHVYLIGVTPYPPI